MRGFFGRPKFCFEYLKRRIILSFYASSSFELRDLTEGASCIVLIYNVELTPSYGVTILLVYFYYL
jgi:hypothetical protein